VKDSIRYRILRTLEANPEISQRELARELGLSLGKTNYCLRAVIDKGWIKARNFKNSNNKSAYLYQLTPQGVAAKTRITTRFLDRKVKEFEALEKEISELGQAMNDPAFFRQPPEIVAEKTARAQQLQNELDAAYQRWEELEN